MNNITQLLTRVKILYRKIISFKVLDIVEFYKL
jgi:hypothetical protein